MATISTQHAATFRKNDCPTMDYIFLCSKRNNKRNTLWKLYQSKKELLRQWSQRFNRFVSRMEVICQRHGEKRMSEWMDNQDVCRMLNISPRTLQTLRDNGTLAYSQINHKTYYRPEDVERIVSVIEDRRKEAKFKGKTI